MTLESYIDGPVTGVHPPDIKFWDSFGKVPETVITIKKIEAAVVRRDANKISLKLLENQRDMYVDQSQVPFQLNDDIRVLRRIHLPRLNGRIGGLTAARNRTTKLIK